MNRTWDIHKFSLFICLPALLILSPLVSLSLYIEQGYTFLFHAMILGNNLITQKKINGTVGDWILNTSEGSEYMMFLLKKAQGKKMPQKLY